MDGVVHVIQAVTLTVVAAFAVLVAVRVVRLVVRRDRAGLRESVARPLLDSARVDAAIHGLNSPTSDDLSIAVEAGAAVRRARSSLPIDVDPLPGLGRTRAS